VKNRKKPDTKPPTRGTSGQKKLVRQEGGLAKDRHGGAGHSANQIRKKGPGLRPKSPTMTKRKRGGLSYKKGTNLVKSLPTVKGIQNRNNRELGNALS